MCTLATNHSSKLFKCCRRNKNLSLQFFAYTYQGLSRPSGDFIGKQIGHSITVVEVSFKKRYKFNLCLLSSYTNFCEANDTAWK